MWRRPPAWLALRPLPAGVAPCDYDGTMDDGSGFGNGIDLKGLDPNKLAGLAGALGLGSPTRGDAPGKRDPAQTADAGSAADRTPIVELEGEARPAGPGAAAEHVIVALDTAGLTLRLDSGRPIRAAYRDLGTIAIQQETALLVFGDGAGAVRFILGKFGDKLGPLIRMLRELRLKQRLTDGLVQVPDDPAELVEFAWTPTTSPLGPGPDGPAAAAAGVGQMVTHAWGFVVSPLDERQGWIHYRRAVITSVTTPEPGQVVVDGRPGTVTLRGLGSASTRLRDKLQKLRDGAFDDASGFVEQLMPDVPFALRQKASQLLVDGQPTRPVAFGDTGWPVVESAILGEPTFADSYRSLGETAGVSAPRWVAMSPVDPGSSENKTWFLVAMPGNLVALELVSAGSHATYFFRVMPRAQYVGEAPEALGIAAERAVRDVSEALVDCRFLREPMALPADQLKLPKYLRYRLALDVLPTLAWARARFVARIVHRGQGWANSVADLIKWHTTVKDEAAEWPGRAAQEASISRIGGEGGNPDDAAGSVDDADNGAGADPAADAGGGLNSGEESTAAKKRGPSGSGG
jgi:hypothetical protein